MSVCLHYAQYFVILLLAVCIAVAPNCIDFLHVFVCQHVGLLPLPLKLGYIYRMLWCLATRVLIYYARLIVSILGILLSYSTYFYMYLVVELVHMWYLDYHLLFPFMPECCSLLSYFDTLSLLGIAFFGVIVLSCR